MFNSLNSTGMPLTDADIISAKLYSKAKSKNEEDFKDNWRDLINSISANEININSVLQQYMYIYRAKKEPNVSSSMPALRSFYTATGASFHSELLERPSDLCKELNKIVETWLKVSDNPMVRLLLKFNDNIKLFFISFLNRFSEDEISEDKFLDVTKCLIRLFTVYELIEAPYSDKKFKTFLFAENAKLVDKDCDVKVIEDDFNKHIKDCWKKDDLKNLLNEYDSTNPVFVFLNEYLYAEEKGKPFTFKDDVNVEHIMPNSGRKQVATQKDANIDSAEEFESYVNRLGNKILLEENINKSLGDDWFRCKKSNSVSGEGGYKGYKDSQYLIAQALVDYPKDKWTKEDIKIATKKAADRILKFIFNE